MQNPEDADSYYGLGWAYSQLEEYVLASDALIKAVKLQPDYTYAHYSLGMTYLVQGDRNAALDEYKILMDLDKEIANQLFDMIYQ